MGARSRLTGRLVPALLLLFLSHLLWSGDVAFAGAVGKASRSRAGSVRRHFFAGKEQGIAGLSSPSESSSPPVSSSTAEPPEDDELNSEDDELNSEDAELNSSGFIRAPRFYVDPSPFIKVAGDPGNAFEMAQELRTALRRGKSKMVVLWLSDISQRAKLPKIIFSYRDDPLFAQILPRHRSWRALRIRVIRSLPLKLPRADDAEVPGTRVAASTNISSLARAVRIGLTRESRYFKILFRGNAAFDVALRSLERVQFRFWGEVSFAIEEQDGQKVLWVHAGSDAHPVPPEQQWRLFPTVTDTGSDSHQDLAERVASLLQVHSIFWVDLVSVRMHTVILALASLHTELGAVSLVGPRPSDTSFCARIIKHGPLGEPEPGWTQRVSNTTARWQLKGALQALMKQQPPGRVARLESIGEEASVRALQGIESLKFHGNSEVMFKVTVEDAPELDGLKLFLFDVASV